MRCWKSTATYSCQSHSAIAFTTHDAHNIQRFRKDYHETCCRAIFVTKTKTNYYCTSLCDYENENFDNLWNENDIKIKITVGKRTKTRTIITEKKRKLIKLINSRSEIPLDVCVCVCGINGMTSIAIISWQTKMKKWEILWLTKIGCRREALSLWREPCPTLCRCFGSFELIYNAVA